MTPPEQNKVPTPRTDAVFDKIADLYCAQTSVVAGVLWKKFIKGTPLNNDIAVWMVNFAHQKKAAFEQLERELVEAKESANKWAGIAGSFVANVKLLEQQLSTLTKPIEPEELRKAVSVVDTYCKADWVPKDYFNAIQTLLLAMRQMREALTDIASSNCSETVFNKATKALNQLKNRGDGE